MSMAIEFIVSLYALPNDAHVFDQIGSHLLHSSFYLPPSPSSSDPFGKCQI